MIHLAAVGVRYARDGRGFLRVVEAAVEPVTVLCGARIPDRAEATVCVHDDPRACPYCVRVRTREHALGFAHVRPLWFDAPVQRGDALSLEVAQR